MKGRAVTVRMVNPHEVSFAGEGLSGCREARLTVRPRRVRGSAGDGQRYETHVEVEGPRHVIEIDSEDAGAAKVGLGDRGALSFEVEKADGSGTVSVSAGNAVVVGQKTRFLNETEGVSVTTVRFLCQLGWDGSEPVSIG